MRHQNRTRNEYCNIDFVFTLDQTNASFICGIKVIFSIMNLFLKCILSDLKSLSSMWFDMRGISYLWYNTCTVTEVASGVIVNASNKELQVCVWYKFIRH